MNVVQVSATDRVGGAASFAWSVFEYLRRRGHDSFMAVGRKTTADDHVIELRAADEIPGWSSFWYGCQSRLEPLAGRVPGAGRLRLFCHRAAYPRRVVDWVSGREDLGLPASRRLFELMPVEPDVIHCHNLHGFGLTSHFDLTWLPELSRRTPVLLTLHDAWLLSGHCAHSLGCQRWETGCGSCPDLAIYPAIRRDGTAANWRRKRAIFRDSSFYVAAPCRWLLARAERSILEAGVIESRLIPHGVDLDIFRPRDRPQLRRALDLPGDATIVLFVAQFGRANPFREFATLESALARLADRPMRRRLLLLCIGGSSESRIHWAIEQRNLPFVGDPGVLADYYGAADVYVHPAREDTFPTTVLEAMACGLPTVATNVGGIPEQIVDSRVAARDTATGVLFERGDAEELAASLSLILDNDQLRSVLGRNAAARCREHFSLRLCLTRYESLLSEIVDDRQRSGRWRRQGRPAS